MSMSNLSETQKRLFRIIFYIALVKMPKKPKKQVRKLFKVKKKTIKDDKNNFVIRFKNLSSAEQKDLRADLDIFIASYFDFDQQAEETKAE